MHLGDKAAQWVICESFLLGALSAALPDQLRSPSLDNSTKQGPCRAAKA